MNREPICKVLKSARLAKNLSILDVQNLLRFEYEIEISDKTIYKWESGDVKMNADIFLALCQIYDIRDLKIFTERYKQNKDLMLTKAEEHIIQCYRRDDEMRKEIQDITRMPFSLCGKPSKYIRK